MKRFLLISISLLLAFCSMAQTQQGYVKTKGRLVKGQVVSGQRLAGATIQVKGRNTVISQQGGTFSFPIPVGKFSIQSVKKQGYILSDPDVLSKQYSYSTNPLIFVMETPSQQMADKLAAERKLRQTLSRQLQQREDEIEKLKEQNELTEEQYHKALQDLYAEQEKSLNLVSQIAERYSRVDFDQLDEFNRRISDCIIEGRLAEADSLIRSKGNLMVRIGAYNKHHEANVLARKQLEDSEVLELKNREDLARDCYNQFLIHKLQHLPDSAAYYIEQRALLDTTNVDWLYEAACYLKDIGNVDKALSLFKRAHDQYVVLGINDIRHAVILENIADFLYIFSKNDKIDRVINYYNLAIDAFESMSPLHPHLVHCYDYLALSIINKMAISGKSMSVESVNEALLGSKIGSLLIKDNIVDSIPLFYGSRVMMNKIIGSQVIDVDNIYFGEVIDSNNYEKLVDYYKRASSKVDSIYGSNSELYAKTQKSLGDVYSRFFFDRDKALECYESARRVFSNIDSVHSELGDLYYKLLSIYLSIEDTVTAIDYGKRALWVYQSMHGSYHPKLNLVYSKLIRTYENIKDYNQALYYAFELAEWNKHFYGESRDPGYLMISSVYRNKGDYDNAIVYLDEYKRLIDRSNYGKYYRELGDVQFLKDEYSKAVKSYQQTVDLVKAECDSVPPSYWDEYGLIGLVYLSQGDTVRAVDYYIQSLDLLQSGKWSKEWSEDIARCHINLNRFYAQSDYLQAVNCFNEFLNDISHEKSSVHKYEDEDLLLSRPASRILKMIKQRNELNE